MKSICEKCTHRKDCKLPCRPVELYLAQDNLTVYEKTGIGENGEEISIIFTRSREIPESMLPQISDITKSIKLIAKYQAAYRTSLTKKNLSTM